MILNILKNRRDRAAAIAQQEREIEENYRMKELISIASKNGMKN